MRESRSSGSVEGVMGNLDLYSDSVRITPTDFRAPSGRSTVCETHLPSK